MILETCGKNGIVEFIVDDNLGELIGQSRWYLFTGTSGRTFVMTNYCKSNGPSARDRKGTIYLNKFVYEQVNGKIIGNDEIKFVNGNHLDYRIENLELISRSENYSNFPGGSSNYVGVSLTTHGANKQGIKYTNWQARVPAYLNNGKFKTLGFYKTELRAALAIQFYVGSHKLLVKGE